MVEGIGHKANDTRVEGIGHGAMDIEQRAKYEGHGETDREHMREG